MKNNFLLIWHEQFERIKKVHIENWILRLNKFHSIFTIKNTDHPWAWNSLALMCKTLHWLFLSFFLNTAKRIPHCRSHAKGNSQKFRIEEMEEL